MLIVSGVFLSLVASIFGRFRQSPVYIINFLLTLFALRFHSELSIFSAVLNHTDDETCQIFKQSYDYGRIHHEYLSAEQEELTNQGYTLFEGPGTFFWSGFALDNQTSVLYNRSTILVFAQQNFYDRSLVKSYKPLSVSKQVKVLNDLSFCLPDSEKCFLVNRTCNADEKFQTIDGVCSNLDNPGWAAQNAQYFRLGCPYYQDGIHEIPKSTLTNDDLPPARLIGNRAFKQLSFTKLPTRIGNYGGLLYGQFITHDMGFRVPYQNDQGGDGLRCCALDSSRTLPPDQTHFGCLPITVPSNDTILSQYGVGCLNFLRTQTTLPTNCEFGAAEKTSVSTTILDASQIYGNNESVLNGLRSFQNGTLRMANNILPPLDNCTEPGFCYSLGDGRGLFFPNLALINSLFIRFHNKLANQLTVLNSHWNDTRTFYETRRIIVGIHQHFTYHEWLPIFLGNAELDKQNITCVSNSSVFCGEYNPEINPSSSNEFSQSAFRVYHQIIPALFNTYTADYKFKKSFNISEFQISLDILRTQYNDFLRGLMIQPVQFDTYNVEFRNNLFTKSDPLYTGLGIDLLSNDILVNRDHGLQPYYVFKDKLMGTKTKNWSDLEGCISKENIQILKSLYECVFDLDLYVGMSLEQRSGVYLGPVGRYIVGEQFFRSKYGNRFFYTFEKGPYPFTKDQLTEIKRYTLANLYCENSSIKEVQQWAMEVPTKTNAFANCTSYKPFNVSVFKCLT